MKTIVLLAAVALLAALAAAHSDTEQNDVLARDVREAGNRDSRKKDTKRKKIKKHKNARRAKARAAKRKSRKNKNKKNNQKKKQAKRTQRKRKGSLPKNQCNATLSAIRAQKASAWISSIINIRTVLRILDAKKNSTQNADQNKPKLFVSTAEAIGKVTGDGTQCSGDCQQSTCDAYNTLLKCQETAKADCDYSIAYKADEDFEEECLKKMTLIKYSCKDNLCCGKEEPDFDKKCNFAEKIKEARKARAKCQDSIGVCMSLVKEAPSMISSCAAGAATTNEVLSTKNVINRNTFIEDGVAYEQVTSYDPVTQEATFTVPAHSNRVAVNIIAGKEKIVTATNDYCLVETTPSDFNVEDFGEQQEEKDPETDQREKNYWVYTYGKQLTEEEKETLSATALKSCEGRTIRWATKEKIDADSFNSFNAAGGRTITSRQSQGNTPSFSNTNETIPGCTSVKVRHDDV